MQNTQSKDLRRVQGACALLLASMIIGGAGFAKLGTQSFLEAAIAKNEAHAERTLVRIAEAWRRDGWSAALRAMPHGLKRSARSRTTWRGYVFEIVPGVAPAPRLLAWPLAYAKSGRRAFALEGGEIQSWDNAIERFSGALDAPRIRRSRPRNPGRSSPAKKATLLEDAR